MATFTHVNSRRMYSWWWDSHISPKNSKWLQENLTDMDAKVKSMIKLIEEDADSFARRAEMYYKKRPELMKMVEEFYRAYRALAERYDHATGVIRHAHRTMTEAFPNQVPPMLDDPSANFGPGAETQTADMSTPARGFFEPDELQNGSLGLSLSPSNDAKRNDAKFMDGKVRKSLKFPESVEKDEPSESEEILSLKKALAELEAEKEAGLSQYQQSLEKLSMLESEISRVQEGSKALSEQASRAEAEAQSLKEALAKLEAEKESNLLQYRQCLEKISDLGNSVSHAEKDAQELTERAVKAEVEAQSVKDELAKVATEKDAALNQYMSSLELISNLEHKLQCAEEDARKFKERAQSAENEVEALKQAISRLTEEKEASELQYCQCMETISSLESKLSLAQEEAQQLKTEIEKGIADLKGAEEQCLLLERRNRSLHEELETLILKTGSQSQELTDKQKELGRLWTCIQEERLRFVEAETAFQTLQHLHAQAQEELRSLTFELQNKVRSLAETETQKKILHEEVLKVKEENKNLNELSVSSAITIKDLQNEISSLTETKGKLEQEVELRVDQRNALQQEIYCMKEELNELNRKNSSIMEQVHAAGLDAESFGSAVRILQDENSNLKETCQRETSEKLALLEKLEILEQLLEKNSLLENSLSDLNAEMETVRGKIHSLEESCQSLVEEKSSLLDEKASLQIQLQAANGNLGELAEKNTALENSLCDAHDELQVLKTKSVSLEESFQLLSNEKGIVAAENDALNSQFQSTQMRLENLEKRYAEMGEQYSALEKEKELSVGKIQELQISLDVQKQEHASFAHEKELQLASVKNELQLLQQDVKFTKTELEKELENAFESQTEVFILRRCAQDLEDKNLSLSTKNKKLLETSISLEGMLHNLKQDNLNQKGEIMSLCDQSSTLRKGIDKLIKALDIVLEHDCEGRSEQDHLYLNHILNKLDDIKNSFCKSEEETLHRSIELSVLLTMLGQLRFHFENLELEKSSIEREFRIRGEQLSASQNEAFMLHEMNEEMRSKVMEGQHKQEALMIQVSGLEKKLMDLQQSYQDLQRENVKILEEKGSLTKKLLQMEENTHLLEGENSSLCSEILSLDCLSIFLKNCVGEKSVELSKLVEELENLNVVNGDVRQRLNTTKWKLEELLVLKELELQKLHEEHQQTKFKEESLQSELDMVKNEADIWEAYALDAFVELQVSNLFQMLYEEKIHELTKTCDIFKDENATKDTDIRLLRERESILASENEGFNAKLAAFIPAITSLGSHISSLEEHTSSHGHLEVPENANLKDDALVAANHVRESNNNSNHDELVVDSVSHLESLQRRIQSIEKAVASKEQLLLQENQSVHSELEAAMRLVADLKSENSQQRRRSSKPTSEVLEVDNGLLPKDIMLDQVSEFSPYRRSSRREQVGPDIRNLESWDAADQDGSIDLTVSKTSKILNPATDRITSFHRVKSAKKQRNDLPTEDILVEKELGVDKLEVSKRFSEPLLEGSKRKVLERLNSDVQKLTNLQITVQDLKRKLQNIEKSKKGKAIDECDILKEQLEEADAAILKLFDLNGKLTKNMEGTPLSSHAKSSSVDSDESGSVKKRKVAEQARRISERIGRLQLEVQKIQFVLLKLDDEKDGKGKSKISEAKRRVLLRDYLYGYGVLRSSSHRRKKGAFCGCVQPRTEGD